MTQTHSHRVISASPAPLPYPSAPGVLAAELLVLRDDALVDGLTLRDGMAPYMPAPWPLFSSTAYAKSPCAGLKLYESTDGSWIMLRTRGIAPLPEWSSAGCGDVDGLCEGWSEYGEG